MAGRGYQSELPPPPSEPPLLPEFQDELPESEDEPESHEDEDPPLSLLDDEEPPLSHEELDSDQIHPDLRRQRDQIDSYNVTESTRVRREPDRARIRPSAPEAAAPRDGDGTSPTATSYWAEGTATLRGANSEGGPARRCAA